MRPSAIVILSMIPSDKYLFNSIMLCEMRMMRRVIEKSIVVISYKVRLVKKCLIIIRIADFAESSVFFPNIFSIKKEGWQKKIILKQ
jgi:hypothetical protein